MAVPDFFNNDAFSQRKLIASINAPAEGQSSPNVVDALFNEEGISDRKVYIEMQDNTLSLVPAASYGGPGDVTSIPGRSAKSFDLIHLPTVGAVMASEVQGIRAYGSENDSEVYQMRVDAVLEKMRRRLEATRRYQRIKALQGKIYDADGTTVLLDIFAEFGVTQITQPFTLGTATTKIKAVLEAAKSASEDAVGDSSSIIGWNMYCGKTFHQNFVGHDKVESAFDRYTGGAFQAESQMNRAFQFADVNVYRLNGSIGGVAFVPANEAYLVPILDSTSAYITRYGPANYADTVNTIGLPFYASADPMPHNKGMSLEAQSNVLSLPTIPRSIIRCTG